MDYHSLCLLQAELLGVAMLGTGGPGWRGIHIKGSIEVNIITEGWPSELQVQHLYRCWAKGRDNLVTWDHRSPGSHS
jgi:hypothetical protein